MHTIYTQAYRTMMATLRQRRVDAGLRQDDIARRLGCSRERVTKLERGMLRLDVVQFIHTCHAYRISPTKLMQQLENDLSDGGLFFTYQILKRRHQISCICETSGVSIMLTLETETMRRILATLFALLSFNALAAALFPCPDCEQKVSPRAVMCPHCGCPGEAIHDAVAAAETLQRPPPVHPVAPFKTDSSKGTAVAYTDGEHRYLVLDALPLFGVASLDITPLTTNAPIPYHSMQVAAEAPLVRFRTVATNLEFLVRAPLPAARRPDLMWLHADGLTTPRGAEAPPRSAVALVDAKTNLVSVIGRDLDERPLHVQFDATWVNVGPSQFRTQTSALRAAHHALATESSSAESVRDLGHTEWVTPFLQRTAAKLIRLSETKGSP